MNEALACSKSATFQIPGPIARTVGHFQVLGESGPEKRSFRFRTGAETAAKTTSRGLASMVRAGPVRWPVHVHGHRADLGAAPSSPVTVPRCSGPGSRNAEANASTPVCQGRSMRRPSIGADARRTRPGAAGCASGAVPAATERSKRLTHPAAAEPGPAGAQNLRIMTPAIAPAGQGPWRRESSPAGLSLRRK